MLQSWSNETLKKKFANQKKKTRIERNLTSSMPVVIQNFRCARIPELKIIGIGTNPINYLAHATQVVGLLTRKSIRTASTALQNFIRDSEEARMRNGGDLETMYQSGDMDAMIYTHSGTNPSYFFTIEGVEETLRSLPNQVEDTRQRFRELFEAYRASASSTFNLDMSNDELPLDEGDEDERDATGSDDLAALVPRSMLFDVRLQSYIKQTEAQLTLERERTAMERERTAMATTMAKMNAGKDKEMADLVLRTEREKADLQLKSEKEKNDLQLKSEKEKTDLLMRLRDFELQSEKEKSQAKDAIIEQMKKQLETAGRTESERAKKRASTASDPSEQDDSPVPFRLTIPNEVSGFVIVH